HNDRLFLAWRGDGANYLNLRVSADGSFRPPGPWIFADLSWAGMFLAAYRTPPAPTNAPDPPPDNLGFVYVMEAQNAAGIDFATFRQRILDSNAGLPPLIGYGSTLQFNTPDDRRYSIWFQLTGNKATARIVDLNDPAAVRDLSTLPLASGDYLNTP